ncbi:helix-turn-helix domain-containing protein [Streptomyces niveus]|uniref:helix-turn-helix domain-containing protein n=1 Tax=Streptomyces niveus TaxID=193462 RepID=UPI0036993B36
MCRILLRLQLRRLREAKGLTAGAVAKQYGWSDARMTRLETGSGAVEVGTVRVLCELYETSLELRDELEGYALTTMTKRDWWDTKPFKGTVPRWFQAYLGLEAAAQRLRIYQSEFAPGIVQTPHYAMAILGLSGAGDATVERHAKVRLKRQSILWRAEAPPEVSIILNEAVIRRPVGGPAVMREQLERICTLTELPNVAVQVLPFSVGAHPAMHGPFTVLGFPDETVGDLAYLENLVDSGVLSEPQMVAPFIDTFDTLQDLALDQKASLAAIRDAAKDL